MAHLQNLHAPCACQARACVLCAHLCTVFVHEHDRASMQQTSQSTLHARHPSTCILHVLHFTLHHTSSHLSSAYLLGDLVFNSCHHPHPSRFKIPILWSHISSAAKLWRFWGYVDYDSKGRDWIVYGTIIELHIWDLAASQQWSSCVFLPSWRFQIVLNT